MTETFVIILDEDMVQFLDEVAGGDPNAYINRLLMQEKQRHPHQPKLQELLDSTPNAST